MSKSLLDALNETLPKDLGAFFGKLAEIGASVGIKCHLVGGAVRDLYLLANGLKVDIYDYDIMCDGLSLDVVEALRASSVKDPTIPRISKIVGFKKYMTAKVSFLSEIAPGVDHLDFSSSRSEVYPISGANPTIARGTVEQDLKRRDFGVNALAIELGIREPYRVLDLVGGIADLDKREIRILHEKSFEDDPARILRALRLMTRGSGFTLERKTKELLSAAAEARFLQRLPKLRLFDEFRKGVEERFREKFLSLLIDQNLHTDFNLSPKQVLDFAQELEANADSKPWRVLWDLLGENDAQKFFSYFELTPGSVRQLLSEV